MCLMVGIMETVGITMAGSWAFRQPIRQHRRLGPPEHGAEGVGRLAALPLRTESFSLQQATPLVRLRGLVVRHYYASVPDLYLLGDRPIISLRKIGRSSMRLTLTWVVQAP